MPSILVENHFLEASRQVDGMCKFTPKPLPYFCSGKTPKMTHSGPKKCTVALRERQFATLYLFHAYTVDTSVSPVRQPKEARNSFKRCLGLFFRNSWYCGLPYPPPLGLARRSTLCSDFIFPLQPPPPTGRQTPRRSHPRALDFGPFRLRFGSVWLRFGSVSGSFRVRFGVLGGVGVGSGRGAFVREKNITSPQEESLGEGVVLPLFGKVPTCVLSVLVGQADKPGNPQPY